MFEVAIFGVSARKLESAEGVVALIFSEPSAEPPFTVVLVPLPTLQVGQETTTAPTVGLTTIGELPVTPVTAPAVPGQGRTPADTVQVELSGSTTPKVLLVDLAMKLPGIRFVAL
jgi:hypothetical protein